jgi:hypothetical protein
VTKRYSLKDLYWGHLSHAIMCRQQGGSLTQTARWHFEVARQLRLKGGLRRLP